MDFFGDPISPALLIGGYDSLENAIKAKTVAPKGCKTGKSYVSFVIDSIGAVSQVKIVKGLCPKADSIAIEIVKALKFKRATYFDEPISVKKFIPIEFHKK